MAKKVTRRGGNPDWNALRRDYENGSDPHSKLAKRYGTTPAAINARQRNEGWRKKYQGKSRTTATNPGKVRATPSVDWAAVRAEYETCEFSIFEICERHGISHAPLYRRRMIEGWPLRSPGSGRVRHAEARTGERLKALVERELRAIEEKLKRGSADDCGDPLRSLHTLATTANRAVELELRERQIDERGGGQQRIDDAARLALAERLEALAERWAAEEGCSHT